MRRIFYHTNSQEKGNLLTAPLDYKYASDFNNAAISGLASNLSSISWSDCAVSDAFSSCTLQVIGTPLVW